MWRWLKEWLGPDKVSVMVQQLLAEAERLGLPARDVAIAQEYVDYAEWGLAFEHIVTQLFECATALTAIFYEQVEACADTMKISSSAYSILLPLVRHDDI